MQRNRNRFQQQALIEGLESRRLLTALTVNGTVGNDVISVSFTDGPLFDFINVTVNGATVNHLATSVSSIGINAFGGNDLVAIGNGVMGVTINGGTGNDSLYGGQFNDYIQGSDGNDLLSGGAGNDTLDGWNGNDAIYGSTGNDCLLGYYGDDYLSGGAGNDSLYGEGDCDTLHGGSGRDYMSGGAGNDFFYAHDDEVDTLSGGDGWDTAQVDDAAWWEFWATQDSWSGVENAFEP